MVSQNTGFQEAARTQTSLLAAVEKRTLIWFAHHMPAWINSDHLTTLGVLGMLLAGLSYWWARWNPLALLLVCFFLMINWFGDSLDGTLARVRNHLRPRYGFYVDHLVDAFGALFLLAGLGLSGYMSMPVAAALLITYYLLSIEIYLATYSLRVFKISYGIFGPTELRIALCIGNIFLLFRPDVHINGQVYRLFDVSGVVGMVFLAVILLNSAIRNTHRLYSEEPIA